MKNITILGSTGSIGTQALEIVDKHPDYLKIFALHCDSQIDLLEKQIHTFNPQYAVVSNDALGKQLKNRYSGTTKILIGNEEIERIVVDPAVDLVLTSVVGSIGLLPTLQAIKKGKTIALANKETLVAAGAIVMSHAKRYGATIIPVDSEHSAIFQCLQGSETQEVDSILLTASGGPFRQKDLKDFASITLEEALKHPNWSMGKKITVDSATLMNKGLEVIEAKWLFDLKPNQIQVIVHPQSVIHSMVQFVDSSLLAQMGTPSMLLPIHYALFYPSRRQAHLEPFSFARYNTLTFEAPDFNRFPCLGLAYEALNIGGTMPTVLNAANEMAVKAFLEGRIHFIDIPKWVEGAMGKHKTVKEPTLEDILAVEHETRQLIMT